MVLSVKRTVYPDGSYKEHDGKMRVEINSTPDTKHFNSVFKKANKELNKLVKWKTKSQ